VIKENLMNNLQLKEDMQIVVFTMDKLRYALDLSVVVQIVRAVEITPLPKVPEFVLGVINMQGQVVPVIDIRKRFRMPEREIDINDRYIISRTSRRLVALVADDVVDVQKLGNRKIASTEYDLPFAKYIKGVVKMEEDLVLIYDLEQFLSLDEEQKLDEALTEITE
jgi:purine-binding chemotaxis protein CheW